MRTWNSTIVALMHIVLLDPGTYRYYNATLQRNKEPPKTFPGEYNTDLISNRAVGFLEDAAAADAPFFIGVMPIGPHTETLVPENPGANDLPIFLPPIPAERHKDLYHGVKIPRTDNFNPEKVCLSSFAPNTTGKTNNNSQAVAAM